MDLSSFLRVILLCVLNPFSMAANIKQVIEERNNLVEVRNIFDRMTLDITNLLVSSGPFTMFVPANEAFGADKIPRRQRSSLLSRGRHSLQQQVNNQFKYHLVDGRLRASDLQDGRRITQALNAPYLFIRRMPDGELYVNGARIIERDLEADNGIVHVIDEFLAVPDVPGDGVPMSMGALGYIRGDAQQLTDSNLATQKFTDLLKTYESEFPNRATTLLNSKQMTLFLPSDASLEGFTTSDIANIKQDRLDLQRLVERQIIHTCTATETGECAERDNVYHGGILRDLARKPEVQRIEAMSGQISPTLFNGELYVGNDCGGSKIVWGNITVRNGVIHMIDGFLGFRQRNVLSYLINNELRTFYDLAEGAPTYMKHRLNLGSDSQAVKPEDRVTVFAPIEAAMKDYSLATEDERELHMRYHVLEGELQVKDMLNTTVKTMFPGDDSLDPTIRAKFTQLENGDTYVTVDHVRARIIRPNICVKNGLLHIVDHILGVPLYSIYNFIRIDTLLEFLSQQLSYTGYKQELDSTVKEYTFFAPVNRAMELMRLTKVGKKYLDPLQIANKGSSVLYGRHLTSGSLYIDEITARTTEVVTFATKNMGRSGNNFVIVCNRGEPCYIEFEGEKITFNQTDIKMTNGVVHLINEVIYTDSEARESELVSAAQVNKFSSLIFLLVTMVYILHLEVILL